MQCTAEEKSASCSRCGIIESRRIGRHGDYLLPRNWKKHNDETLCEGCWGNGFVTRAITIPVLGPPISGGTKPETANDELWAALRKSWRACGQAMNYATATLYASDTAVREPHVLGQDGKLKLPKSPPTNKGTEGYTYPAICSRWPVLASGSANAIGRRAEKLYKAKRWEIFTLQSSLPTYRDQPYPVPAQCYRLGKSDDGRTTMSFNLDGKKWTVQIGSRTRFAWQLAAIDKLIEGKGRQAEARISERTCGSIHRSTGTARDSGGQNKKSAIEITIVCQLPVVQKVRCMEGALLIKTHGSSFLSGRRHGRAMDERWTHEDHVRRWVVDHRKRLQRLGDDQKVERRVGLESTVHSIRERICNKQQRRLDTFIQMKSTQVANLAERLGVAEVVYDDSDKSWVTSFPWFRFWEELRRKTSDMGIRLLTLEAKTKQMQDAKETEKWTEMFAEIQKIGQEKETADDVNGS